MSASAASTNRIKKEYKEVCDSKGSAGVWAELVDDSFMHWKGYLTGPENTPYQGGLFVVDISIPKNYPFEPPKMRFDTKVSL
jgi:ubiquitin-conjugating enzyme (huntingtin interacting protein 2)